jgi:hypothetical protein
MVFKEITAGSFVIVYAVHRCAPSFLQLSVTSFLQ